MTFIVGATGASAWLLLIGAGHRGHRLRHVAQHHDQPAQEEVVSPPAPAPGRRQSARANAPLTPVEREQGELQGAGAAAVHVEDGGGPRGCVPPDVGAPGHVAQRHAAAEAYGQAVSRPGRTVTRP